MVVSDRKTTGMPLERIFVFLVGTKIRGLSLSEAREKLIRLQEVKVTSVSLSQSDFCPLNHVHTPVISTRH